MKRHAILFGAVLALLAICIRWLEYRFIVLDYAIEIYGGALAIIFTGLGIAAGNRLTTRKEIVHQVIVEKLVYLQAAPELTAARPEDLGLSKREFEILELMARGLSNQEIAQRAFLSIHTVKTHVSNLFVKLDVKRRTQAVSRAKELNLIS